MDFKELAEERRTVKELCRKHIPSLAVFKFQRGASFKLFWDDPEPEDDGLHHLTTTATCIESLRDCHPMFHSEGAMATIGKSVGAAPKDLPDALVRAFQEGARQRPSEKWLSEDSAPVYCASRALPLSLEGATEWTTNNSSLIGAVFAQLLDPKRFGIGERNKGAGKKDPPWYPENAYHTFWGLKVLKPVRDRFRNEAEAALELDLDRMWESMRLWARAKLTEEVALHWAQSAALDSDQLTWALTTYLKFEGDLSSDLRGQDLVRKAFDALASTQERVGTWRHYRPLFVYSNVGNAYCYVYESFTFLLKAVLEKFGQQEFLEEVIRGFIDHLQRLREYAEMTQVQHKSEPDAVAWSSGHRPAESKPEGWATASVFSYLQAYRRLLGILARRDALRALYKLHGSAPPKDPDPIGTLKERGNSWAPRGVNPVAEDLATLFINPIRMQSAPDHSEPDDQPIEDCQARSAILFGPPGASKTTLAWSVASALDWNYVELHSSGFVAEGIQEVQRTADRIFAYLMELDHTVVLFDEPDELVREREGAADAFGRFLTTSMLPKIAELFKQRKIIYFVATNHIRYFDAAIVRSERFDVITFVPQPSFTTKVDKLRKRLSELTGRDVKIAVSQPEVEDRLGALETFARTRWRENSEASLPPEAQLAKFILLRWDQIDELALRLVSDAPQSRPIIVDSDSLSAALARIGDHRLSRLHTYLEYLDDCEYARRDFRRKPIFAVQAPMPGELPPEVVRNAKGLWLPCESGSCPERVAGYTVVRSDVPGEVRLVLE